MDGILLDSENYTVKTGSTILTLNPDYLNGLAVGTHTLRLEYLYGSAETPFKVVEAKQPAETTKDTTKTTTTQAGKTIAKIMSELVLLFMVYLAHRGAIPF